MFQSNKAKTAGKFIVVMLCFAILFFLLLPFVDNSQPASAAQGKKAVPQIFTSNPLSDLVRKVYALFTRNQKRKAPAVPQVYDYTQQTADASLQQQERFAAQTESADGSGSSASVGASYASYGDAGFINEDGEWVLVRQTTPEAAHRGMHEVNTSDSAYDKLVRLERAAKFTGQPAVIGPQIPDSKWARMWKPIQNFFGFGQENAPAAPKAASDQNAFALASAASAPNQDRAKRGSSYRQYAAPDAWDTNRQNGQRTALPANTLSLEEIINPDLMLNDIKENILEQAQKDFSKDELKDLSSLLNQKQQELVLKAKLQFQNDILAEAQDKPVENLVNKTFSGCSTGSSSLYSDSPSTTCNIPPTPQEVVRQSSEAFAQLQEYAGGQLQHKPNVMVVLGKTKDVNPQLDSPDMKTAKAFYDFLMEKKGCREEECVWVASDIQPHNPQLRNSIQAAGLKFVGAPLKSYQKLLKEFMNTPQFLDLDPQDMIDFQTEKGNLELGYIPLTQKEWLDFTNNNTPENIMKNPSEAFFVFGESAQLADLMKNGLLPNPGMTLRDPEGIILNKDKVQDDLRERAPLFQQSMFTLIDNYKKVANEAKKEFSELGLAELAKKQGQKVLEEFKNNQDKSLDEQMGLSK